MDIFKIRNKEGLFYKSSTTFNNERKIYFHKKGHSYKTLKQVLNSIHLHSKFENCKLILQNCEIVKFELKEIEIIKIE